MFTQEVSKLYWTAIEHDGLDQLVVCDGKKYYIDPNQYSAESYSGGGGGQDWVAYLLGLPGREPPGMTCNPNPKKLTFRGLSGKFKKLKEVANE